MRSGFVGSCKVYCRDFLFRFKATGFCCTNVASHCSTFLSCGARPDSSNGVFGFCECIVETVGLHGAGGAKISCGLRIVLAASSFQKKHFDRCAFAGGFREPVV